MAQMDPNLKKLVDDIKRLVPPSNMVEPSHLLVAHLETLNIEAKDKDAIHRAYNYFNILLGAPLINTPASANAKPSSSLRPGNDTKPKVKPAIEIPDIKSSTQASLAKEALEKEALEKEAEMIDILIRVAEDSVPKSSEAGDENEGEAREVAEREVAEREAAERDAQSKKPPAGVGLKETSDALAQVGEATQKLAQVEQLAQAEKLASPEASQEAGTKLLVESLDKSIDLLTPENESQTPPETKPAGVGLSETTTALTEVEKATEKLREIK